jgi:hypothetical protein
VTQLSYYGFAAEYTEEVTEESAAAAAYRITAASRVTAGFQATTTAADSPTSPQGSVPSPDYWPSKCRKDDHITEGVRYHGQSTNLQA